MSEDIRDAVTTYDFTYNNNGRLATASLNSSTVGTYAYNGLEQRIAKTAGTATTQFVYAPSGHLLAENDGSGNPVREYVWLDELPVSAKRMRLIPTPRAMNSIV